MASPPTQGGTLVTVAGAVFIFPFFVLSALGGELADKYVKSVVARRLKFVEIFAAAFAAAGFFLHSVPLLFVALGLFGDRRRAVRPGEIRHPAGPVVGRRTCDGQRAGRRRDLPRDPDRHHRRRPVRVRLDPSWAGSALAVVVLAVAVLGVCVAHPDDRAIGARSCHHAQSLDLDAAPAARRCRPSSGCGTAW